ncbi:MAG: FHA domain-containing protein [Chloroflexi bacterium]|nr:FHA domain-containing protein [Chloroflexota bacterium]
MTPRPSPTVELNYRPVALPARPQRRIAFAPEANAILQFSPSEACVSLPLDKPVTLGRGEARGADTKLDLNDFGALQHGVSRQHCQLKRVGQQLIIVDLGSANGTFINGDFLKPDEERPLAHGDMIVLGALTVHVFFSK